MSVYSAKEMVLFNRVLLKSGIDVELTGNVGRRDDLVLEIALHQDTRDGLALDGFFKGERTHHFGRFFAFKVELDGHGVSRVVDLDLVVRIVFVFADEGRLESAHFIRFAVHQDNVRRLEEPDEFARLLVVGVGREGDVVDRHLERKLLAGHRCDIFRLGQHVLGQRSFNAVPGDDDAVLGVCAPGLKELARQAALHHAGRCHDNARAHVFKRINALQ